MPATAVGLGISDPFDPKQNIMGGAKYVAELFRTFGSYPNALELVIAAIMRGQTPSRKPVTRFHKTRRRQSCEKGYVLLIHCR